MAVEENFLEHVPLSCLSPSTVRELGFFLDPGGAENDVRRLAEILGCDYIFVRNLEERVDRTKYLFDSWWCLRPDCTVLKLKECLEIMEREDILTDVWPQIEKNAQAWERLPEKDAQALERLPGPIPPDPVPPPIDDSWMLTVHDMDPNKPARYHACLCYEEDDRDTADKFVNELKNIHPDIQFFVPHLHVIPGKYVYDCVAQVIDERCNKKVVIILPKKEFTDPTCDFALQYARALDPFGVIVPVVRDDTVQVPCILQGVAAFRLHRPLYSKMYEQTGNLLKSSNLSEKSKRRNNLSSELSKSDSIYVDKKKYSLLKIMQKRLGRLFFKSSRSKTGIGIDMRSSNSSFSSIEESHTSQPNEEILYRRDEGSGDRASPIQRSRSLNDLDFSMETITLSYSSVRIYADIHTNAEIKESSADEVDSVIAESTERSSNLSIDEEEFSSSNQNRESHGDSSDSGTN